MTTIRKNEDSKEAKRATSHQKQLKKAKAAALKLAEMFKPVNFKLTPKSPASKTAKNKNKALFLFDTEP